MQPQPLKHLSYILFGFAFIFIFVCVHVYVSTTAHVEVRGQPWVCAEFLHCLRQSIFVVFPMYTAD